MAITIGVQQVSQTLNKDDYFTTHTLVKAKNLWAVANLKVATTLGISTAAAKAFTIAITGGLIIAVTAIIAVASHLISKQQEAAKATKELANKTAELASEPLVAVKRLSSEWSSLGNNLNEKEKYILQNQKAFKELGIEINNVADAEALLSDPTRLKAFQDSLMAKAKAAAAMEIATEKYKEAFKKQNEVDQMADKSTIKVGGTYVGGQYGGTVVGAETKEVDNIYKKREQKEADKIFAKGDEFFKIVDEQNKIAADKLKESGATAVDTLVAGSIEAIEAAISLRQAALEKVTNSSDYNKIDAEIKRLENQKEAITGKTGKEKAKKEAYDSEAAITDLILDIRAKRIKLEIDQQKDSLQKRLEGIRAERDEQLRAITDKESDIAAKSPGGKINAAQAKELAGERAKITAAYGKKEVSETEKYQQEISDMVFSFAEERVQIAYNYNKDIEKAREMGLTADADRIEREKQQRIDAVTLGLIEETELYKTATDDKLQLSRETTELLIEDLRRRIEAEIAAGKLSKEQGEKWLKDLDKAKENTSGKNNQNNPFAQLGTAINKKKNADSALENVSPDASVEDLALLESAAAGATASMAGAAGTALQGVQAILDSVVSGLDRLGFLSDEQKKDADNIIGMVGGAADLAMGIATGNPMQIIQGSIDLVVNGMEFFDFKNKALEKSQKQHMKNVEELERAYGKLGRAIERAFSTDKAKLQLAEIDNIQQRIKENEAWVEAERKKKKRKRDNDAIHAKLKEIEDLRNLEQDKREAIVETLTGSTVMSAIDEFANAYADAFTSGEDAALKSAQVIKNILKTALIEKLKKDLQPGITTLMNMISDAMADGIITEGERAAIEAQNKKNDETAARQQKMWKDLGLTDDTTSKQGGIKGDVANMTEQTGSALTGQITAMRLNVVALLNNSKSSLDSMGKVLATLEAIKTNTDRLNRIDETLYYMKINGIKVL
jgi:hypothetical protein